MSQTEIKKVKVGSIEVSVEELIDDAYNICRADQKIRELKRGSHTLRGNSEVDGIDDQESCSA